MSGERKKIKLWQPSLPLFWVFHLFWLIHPVGRRLHFMPDGPLILGGRCVAPDLFLRSERIWRQPRIVFR